MKFSCTYALVDDIIYQSIFISGKFLHYGLRYSYLGKSNFNRKSMLYFHIILENKAGFLKKYISQNSCEASKEEVLMKIVSLKEDFAFKELMSNEVVRRYFLAATLGVPVESIRSVRLMNTFLGRKWRNQKQGILDVQIEFNDNAKVNLEMQVVRQKHWHKRNLFYLAKMYVDDLRWGEDYDRLRRSIGISILDYNLLDDSNGHHIYRLRDEEGKDFSDLLELHIIELRKTFSNEDSLVDWVKLFNVTTEEDIDMIKSSDVGIQEGIRMMREMSLTKRIRLEIEAREKARRDRADQLAYARDEGITIGEQKCNQLYAALLADNRIDDMKRATNDIEFQDKLMREYGIK